VITVGERALAACPVADRTTASLDWYTAQWAASEDAVRSVFAQPTDALYRYDWQYQKREEWSSVIDTLDYLQFEALYRVSGSGVQVYLPLWLGFGPEERTTPSTGALLETHSVAEFRQLREHARRLKATLGRAVEEGTISLEIARYILLSVLPSRACYCSK
jgi:hypothetical protein